MIHLEDRGERRELLDEPPPLVGATHALHHQRRGADLDDVLVLERSEVDLEIGLAPDEETVDGLLAPQPSDLGVDDLAVLEPDVAEARAALEGDRAALARDLECLEEVDHGHLVDRSGEARSERRRLLRRDRVLCAAREDHVHAGEQLAHEDRLREVVLHAELESSDLVLHRVVRGEEDDRDRRILAPVPEAPNERVTVELGKLGVADDEIRRLRIDHVERRLAVLDASDVVASLPKADLDDPHASRVRIDEEDLLLGHARS